MKIVAGLYILDPNTFKPLGPVCCEFILNMNRYDELVTWLQENVGGEAPEQRIWIDANRMTMFPRSKLYLETLDQATLFKLAWS